MISCGTVDIICGVSGCGTVDIQCVWWVIGCGTVEHCVVSDLLWHSRYTVCGEWLIVGQWIYSVFNDWLWDSKYTVCREWLVVGQWIYIVFSNWLWDTLRISEYIALNSRINDELSRFVRKKLWCCSGHILTFAWRDWGKPWRTSGCMASCPTFELGTYRIQV